MDAEYAVDILPAALLIGAGVGVAFPSLLTLALSGATERDAGLASGLVNTTFQVGGALGLAVLATLSNSRTESRLANGASEASALTSGYHLAFVVGACVVAAAIVVAVTVLQPVSPATQGEDVGETERALPKAA